uniref:ASXH domain-containing protein n=1 Tax=Echinostoma caproni TaxID=27848 RepID=A0A183B712_9TREM
LINRDTFYEFPIETQRMLADLLPYYDRQKQSWPTQPSTNGYVEDGPRAQAKLVATMEDESVWLHPSALSNEFFTKALQDYTDRQARGEFAPRLRNRAGLRANAVGRGRYGTTIVNADLISGKQTLKHTNPTGAPKSPTTTTLFKCFKDIKGHHRGKLPLTCGELPSVSAYAAP